MDEQIKKALFAKNDKLINMVVERIKRDFTDDIAIVGLYGSFATNDFYEKSDLDLVIINNTDKGWEISRSFILGDVGYDIYCTPWDTRIKDEAQLESDMVSSLINLKLLYVAKPEYEKRLAEYQEQARALLSKPIGRECLERAQKRIDKAKQSYADMLLSVSLSDIRFASGSVLYSLINAIVHMNNSYLMFGVKRCLQELNTYKYLPDNFEEQFLDVIKAKTPEEISHATGRILKNTLKLYDELCSRFLEKTVPSFENLAGSYEEFWSNYYNKIVHSVAQGDISAAFHAALGAQGYINEMPEVCGLPKIELIKDFDPENLSALKAAMDHVVKVYEEEYKKHGRKIERYDTFEELYSDFMGN